MTSRRHGFDATGRSPRRRSDLGARSEATETEEITALSAVFRLLGDPTRVRILYTLLETGERCVSDLATDVGAPESSVSHALRLLRTAGIVRNRRHGRMIYYTLADAHVTLLLEVSRHHLREDRS